MFYLETKDGEKFFTDKDSDDFQEFDKIIDTKLGREASDMFNTLIGDVRTTVENKLEQTAARLLAEVTDLDKALVEPELDKDRLLDILSHLQAIYTSIS